MIEGVRRPSAPLYEFENLRGEDATYQHVHIQYKHTLCHIVNQPPKAC